MAQEVGSLYYDMGIDSRKLSSQLGRADGQVKSFGQRLGAQWDKSVAASQRLASGFAVIGAAAVGFGVKSLRAFKESETVMAQTRAVLKSTGGVSKVTAEEISRLSGKMQSLSKFTDEEVQSGQNLLLTFTKIGRDIFPEATEVMVDMSAALGQDMKASAIQLGKALNDPIRGVTALRRVGVSFTSQQEEQIKKMVESGKVLEAQKFIMAELKTEFGGSAKAASDAAGPMERLKDVFNDSEEIIGELVNRAITPLVDKLADWTEKIDQKKIEDFVNNVLKWLRDHGETLAGVVGGALAPAVAALALSFGTLALRLAPFMALGALIANFDDIKKKFFELHPVLKVAISLFGAMALLIAGEFVLSLATASGKLLAFASSSGTLGILKAVLMTFMGPAGLWMLLAAAAAAAVALIVIEWNKTQRAVDDSARKVKGHINDLHEQLGKLDKKAKNYLLKLEIINRGIAEQKKILAESGGIKASDFKMTSFLKPFAKGGYFRADGPMLVGEKGPEIIWPSKPGYVQPNEDLAQKPTVSIGTIVIHDRQDADYFLRRLDRNAQLEGMGLSPA